MRNVLIVFQSDTEPLEQMALAVAVGAVEAGAAIRLRRLAAPGAPELGHRSYGEIKPADVEWAETIVVGLERAEPVAEELIPLLELLVKVGAKARSGWTFGADGPGGSSAARELVESAMREAGIAVGVPEGASGTWGRCTR
jgi:hypothetical protein